MSAETSREDPRHIFLEPECCADPSVGRCWAAHNEWPLDDCDVQAEATQYVRADLVAVLERERDAATARAEAAERERDALRDEWEEIAAGITTEQPEVGALWPMVSEVSGNLAAARNLFRNEVVAHNRTKAERDRLREALEKAAIAAEVESAGHAIAIIEAALTSAKEG